MGWDISQTMSADFARMNVQLENLLKNMCNVLEARLEITLTLKWDRKHRLIKLSLFHGLFYGHANLILLRTFFVLC